jgi:hypothetical protein
MNDFKSGLLKTGEKKLTERSVKKEKLSERVTNERVFFF